MLLAVNAGAQLPRLTVVSYDIGSPKRARRVRRVLDPLRRAKQYSVYETLLHRGEFRGVLAELTEYCDLAQDKVAVWWPARAIRIEWLSGALRQIACGPQPTSVIEAVRTSERSGNFVVCYDVSEPETLAKVADCVAAQGAFLHRSVYWLRLRYRPLAAILERCGKLLGDDDRLWAYPLQGADDLWRVGPEVSSVLPVTADRWRRNS